MPHSSDISPLCHVADMLLEGKLAEFIAERRPRAWQRIARDLWEATDGKVDVSAETLRVWARLLGIEAVSA